MRKDLATHGKHGKQKKVRNKENKEKAKIKIKQRYEKDRTCLLIHDKLQELSSSSYKNKNLERK